MKNLLFFLALCLIQGITAQNSLLSGNVSESVTKGVVVGAKIALKNEGGQVYLTRSDIDGEYAFKNLKQGFYSATVTMLSFDTLSVELEIKSGQNTHDFIVGGGQELEEVQVIGNLAIDRKTPVAVTRISTKQIAEELGSQDLPMILNSTPGVHAIQQGGGDGDARITIRNISDVRNIQINDILGKMVLSQNNTKNHMTLTINKPNGVYYVQLAFKNGEKVIRKVVIK